MSTMTYPGKYQPPAVRRIHRKWETDGNGLPPWEIFRKKDHVVIQSWIPGARREDIDLTIRNHRLYLTVFSSLPSSRLKTFSSIRYEMEIPLPFDVDPSWYAAEFHRGLLILRFPIGQPVAYNGEFKVVVYG